jgi:hypothetical protein
MMLTAGCGGGGGSKGQASAKTTEAAAGTTPTSASNGNRAASIDVCALLSEADAGDVAAKAQFGGAGDTYKLTATKVDQGSLPQSGCKFRIQAVSSSGSVEAGGAVEMDVSSADSFAAVSGGGKAIPGLGDQAVSSGGATVVRVGDLMLQTGEDTFTQTFVVELYKKMIPKLR